MARPYPSFEPLRRQDGLGPGVQPSSASDPELHAPGMAAHGIAVLVIVVRVATIPIVLVGLVVWVAAMAFCVAASIPLWLFARTVRWFKPTGIDAVGARAFSLRLGDGREPVVPVRSAKPR